MRNLRRRRALDGEHINFVLPTEMKRELEQRAEEQIVTVSHLLRQLVRGYLKNVAAKATEPPRSSEVWPLSKPAVREAR
jgi:hypothetical protein